MIILFQKCNRNFLKKFDQTKQRTRNLLKLLLDFLFLKSKIYFILNNIKLGVFLKICENHHNHRISMLIVLLKSSEHYTIKCKHSLL